MDESSMTVIIQTDLYPALTAPSIMRMTSLTYILLVNFITDFFVLSHLTETVLALCILLVIMLLNVDTRTFARYIPPLHMHRRIIMSHSLVAEIK